MQIGKSPLIAGTTLLLILATYSVYSALGQGGAENDGKPRLSSLFSADNHLAQRVQQLEEAVENTNRLQSELLELVEDLHRRLEHLMPPIPEEVNDAARTGSVDNSLAEREEHLRRNPYARHRQMQLQRLINAGINPDRAELILEKQERFQYDHMKLAYAYRHLQDKSSAEAAALREQLNIYSHPRKMLEHELSEEEFELYLQANGQQEMRVTRVISDTPAANAGLRPGDKIISYNGERIFHMGDLRAQIYRVAPGQTVAVEVQRAGSGSREVIYVPSGPLGVQG
ncbi:PDZ domain-containing protein [Microbulbifer thermotolerans]|uniref:PDZ domain-containing protein n=1 Tax=Microbulbifer thermotolerans TaxID=252514 RepID=UPI00224A678E|nr:PDZ domain-containing protein [Microbulbifer thermotolerans]MCX2834793.1 PDZ domain-containing protein [Microbulbifer thermotolerans]WKT61829.1 PDZ domain-containing protein [Microbulbifer thermotolerans]